jgi:hypothetical protein
MLGSNGHAANETPFQPTRRNLQGQNPMPPLNLRKKNKMKTMEGKVERQNPQDRNDQSDSALLSRLAFLKTGAVLATALFMPPALSNVLAGQMAIPGHDSYTTTAD